MQQFDAVVIHSDPGTGSAILDALRTKAGKYIYPVPTITTDSDRGDTIALRTCAVELVRLLATMTEPSAQLTRG